MCKVLALETRGGRIDPTCQPLTLLIPTNQVTVLAGLDSVILCLGFFLNLQIFCFDVDFNVYNRE